MDMRKLVFQTTRVCQLTGGEDRSSPGKLTGAQLSGVTGGVTGTDLGFPFEHDNRLYFLFGDSREFHPDVCEPQWCGTEAIDQGIDVEQPNPERVQRWASIEQWNDFVLRSGGEGKDSIATAPLQFDPDEGIPVRFETTKVGLVSVHGVVGDMVGDAVQLNGPEVAANPQDAWVLAMGNRILVITNEGRVFAHEISGNTIGAPFQLGGPPVAANPQDKWVLAMGDRILVITNEGRVFVHDVTGNSIGVPFQLGGPPVAANPQDKRVLVIGNRLLVVTNDGRVFAHEVSGNAIGVPFQLGGTAVAANPQDKWVLAVGNRILVITSDGRVFVHDISGNTISVPFRMQGPRVAANPRDNLVLVMFDGLLVLTKRDGIFRPTRLNGRVLGRDEGAIGAFTDRQTIYTFFTLTDERGHAHNKKEGGGISVLARSMDDGHNFDQIGLLSRTKFLWAVPVVEQSINLHGLPADVTGPVVLVWGAGRENNDTGVNVAPWNHSYPVLAIAPLSSMGGYETTGNTIGVPFQLGGPAVASNPQDRRVLVTGKRILVIVNDGRVFVHDVTNNSIGAPFQLGGPPVASHPQDKWALAMGNRILVITNDGRVFAHEVSGNTIGVPFQLGGPPVGANPQDKWVLAVGDRILVITSAGRAFVHDVTGNSIGIPFQLGGPPVAANPQDKRVLVIGNRLLVVTDDGRVFAHEVGGNTIGIPFQLGGPRVAANPPDKWVLVMGDRILVVVNDGRVFAHEIMTKTPWRYYAGVTAQGQPEWKEEEARAQPLPPFGSPELPRDFHKSLGDFSVRFIEGWKKWVMLYTCNDDPVAGYNKNNGPRGILSSDGGPSLGSVVGSTAHLRS